jgi:hypothetical protein
MLVMPRVLLMPRVSGESARDVWPTVSTVRTKIRVIARMCVVRHR